MDIKLADSMRNRRITLIFILVAIIVGATYAWGRRHSMNPDGISYLDMTDALRQGEWKAAINACWSPLYPCLLGLAFSILKPSLAWEFPAAHLVNFIIYLLSLGCFHFFLSALLGYRKEQIEQVKKDGDIVLPDWSLLFLGYALFLWSSITLISLTLVTPDMLVAVFVYLAAGILLRIKKNGARWPIFILFGLVLGFGYLAKAVFIPIAIIFLATAFFCVRRRKMAIWLVLLATLSFLLVASPLIITLSKSQGHLTFTESYKPICGGLECQGVLILAHWQGEPSGTGTPRHPTRKIFDQPQIFEFGTPINGTYPPWYAPSYWNEGISSNFTPQELPRTFWANAKEYIHLFFPLQDSLLCGLLIFLFLNGLRTWKKDIRPYLILLIPTLLVLLIYLLVRVRERYVAEFFVILWLCIFATLRLPYLERLKKLPESIVYAIVVLLVLPIFLRSPYYLFADLDSLGLEHIEVAHTLRQQGIEPNDGVAIIGLEKDRHWARVAHVRIVAEILNDEEIQFWLANDSRKSSVYKALSETGAKIAVARNAAYGSLKGWQRIGKTGYYFFSLAK